MPSTRVFSLAVLAALLIAPPTAEAQTSTASPVPAPSVSPMAGHHHHHRRHHGSSLMRALGSLDLTDAQKQQITTYRRQMQTANANADPATRQANAAKLRDEIIGVLTPEQKTRLQTQMHRGHGRADVAPQTAPTTAPN